MSDIVKRLDIKAGVMEMGEKIAWGSDTALMREAARAIEAKDRRIAELEKVAEAQQEYITVLEDTSRESSSLLDVDIVIAVRKKKDEALRAAGYLGEGNE